MSGGRVKVLVVEDNPSDVRVIERLLHESTRPRFEIQVSDRVGSGLEHLASGAVPDVILLDLSLPDSNPGELDSFHRIHSAAPGVPIIIMTGMNDQAMASTAVRHGAQDFLVKGEVGTDVLKRSIRYAMERQSAEEDLRESEERYALAVRGANDGLWDWDLVSDKIYFSPRWKAILGYAESELSTDPGEWLDRVHPSDVHRLRADLEAHVGRDGSEAPVFANHWENEHRIRRKDGSYRWVLIRGASSNRGQKRAGQSPPNGRVADRHQPTEECPEAPPPRCPARCPDPTSKPRPVSGQAGGCCRENAPPARQGCGLLRSAVSGRGSLQAR